MFDDLQILANFGDDADFMPLISVTDDDEPVKGETYPEVLPVLALKNTVLFPGIVIPITIGRDKSILAVKKAEAKGLYEVLQKQADGFDELVKAAGGDAREAVLLLIADKLPELVKTQVEAIKNIKIDKVTVWEGGNQQEGEGNSTSKFISGLYKSVPPMNDLFNMAGMDLPAYLGKKEPEIEDIEAEEVKGQEKG